MTETNGHATTTTTNGAGNGNGHGEPVALKRKDFQSDQEVRWCPGCGDYSVLAAVQFLLPELGVSLENTVFVSGIGCSSRFPYYMETYGMHSIHGRAPAIATGIAVSRPDLDVWVVTGDGDGLSIGGNHLIHALRRNVNFTILLFNNQIYGLTKGQYSPGAAFVEIYQNCNVFNDGAFEAVTARDNRADMMIDVKHGQPIRFGKDGEKGVVATGLGELEIVDVASVGEDQLLVHDEARPDPTLAFALSRLADSPTQPTPMGVFRAVERPVYGDALNSQIAAAQESEGRGDLEALLGSGSTWEV